MAIVSPATFFVEPKWRLGNILEIPIAEIAACDKKKSFARDKQNICDKCLVCAHLAACRGGCTKDKILPADKKTPATYFCESYRQFFDYAMPKFLQIAANMKMPILQAMKLAHRNYQYRYKPKN